MCSRCTFGVIRSCGSGCTGAGGRTARRSTRARGCFRQQGKRKLPKTLNKNTATKTRRSRRRTLCTLHLVHSHLNAGADVVQKLFVFFVTVVVAFCDSWLHFGS